jgi:RNA polymerase sigma-70 factor, ECF subfamily
VRDLTLVDVVCLAGGGSPGTSLRLVTGGARVGWQAGEGRPGGPFPRSVAYDQRSDADLLIEAGRGDGGAFAELTLRYTPRLRGLVRRIAGNDNIVDEAVQETLLRVWRSAERFDPERASVATFTFAIARNVVTDLWRRAQVRPASDGIVVEDMVTARDDVEPMLTGLLVRDALASLSPEHRQVLELGYYQGMRQTEVAERLQIPVGTVKTRTYHALRQLRQQLAEVGGASHG